MIADGKQARGAALIYGVGGGFGHAIRSLRLQALLRERGRESLVLVRRDLLDHPHLPTGGVMQAYEVGSLPDLSANFNCLVVDTFPQGWQQEIRNEDLAAFSERVFLARFQKEIDWAFVERHFHHVLFPYPKGLSEWGQANNRGEFCGHLLRENGCRWIPSGEELILVDPGNRTSAHFQDLLCALSRSAGREFRIVHSFSPNGQVAGRKFLFVGAGYNTFYEVLRQNVDAQFLPLSKRFDDQERRVNMFQKGIFSLRELKNWLGDESPGKPTHRSAHHA